MFTVLKLSDCLQLVDDDLFDAVKAANLDALHYVRRTLVCIFSCESAFGGVPSGVFTIASELKHGTAKMFDANCRFLTFTGGEH
jgi:hypothetical protein